MRPLGACLVVSSVVAMVVGPLSVGSASPASVVSAPPASGARHAPPDQDELMPGSRAVFATRAEAAALLGIEDGFVRSLSPFDRQARRRAAHDVSSEEFLRHVSAQALDWNPAEVEKLRAAMAALRSRLSALLVLPPRVSLVKTTGEEEGGAAYCRGDAVVLPRQIVAQDAAAVSSVLTHELFHIFSKNNPGARERLYAIVGFRPCPEVDLPSELAPLALTNPDAYARDHCTTIVSDGRERTVVPVLFAAAPYDAAAGRTFFEYLRFRLLEVHVEAGRSTVVLEAGWPSLLAPNDSYLDQVGRNTRYVIHPEEVLADNFGLLVREAKTLPSPQVVEGMREILLGVARTRAARP